jgi:hypothetical protein
MKKLLTLLCLLSIGVSVFAQRANYYGVPAKHRPAINTGTRDITTTFMTPLSWLDAASGGLECDLINYYTTDASGNFFGYVVGNNGYGDLEKAMSYDLDFYWEGPLTDGPKVDSVYVFFGVLSTGAAPDEDVVMNIYDGDHDNGPGSVLGTSAVALELVDTTGFLTGFAYPTPVPVSGIFFCSLVLPQGTEDTVDVITTQFGCFETELSAWEKWNDNSWHSFADAWGDNSDPGIFPVVQNGFGVGIQSTGDVTLNPSFPNPASENITLNYLVKRSSNIVINIYDVAGRLLTSVNNGKMSAGINHQQINVSDFTSGVYYYDIVTNSGKVNGSFVVAGN